MQSPLRIEEIIAENIDPCSAADPSHDIWHYGEKPLDAFFKPKIIAVIGASERPGSVGRALASNLIRPDLSAHVFFVNSAHSSVLGRATFPDIASLPAPVDLAVIATPAKTVPGIVSQCADAGVKAAVVISAGFRELGPEGVQLESRIMIEARRSAMRIIGPNCLGIMNPAFGLNATFASRMALPGNVAFISQSGALCTSILDWSLREKVGFSAFVSVGSMADVGWGDLIDAFGDDPATKSILIYMETIGNAKAFLSAAREVALKKPILVLKAGRHEAGMKAALSHTGAIAGSDDALDAAFRRSGVLRVNDIRELFEMAGILAKQPAPKGPKLSILTNAGGPGVLATDALMTAGGQLAELSPGTIQELNAVLPGHWSHGNPVDILGDADPTRYAKALEILSRDPNTDGLLVVLTPQAMTDPLKTAESLAATPTHGKPVLASWMGGSEVEAGKRALCDASIPDLSYPDDAARRFELMWQYSDNLKALYETPARSHFDASAPDSARQSVSEIISKARKEGRVLLSEYESKKILSAYQIPVLQTLVAKTKEEAMELAAIYRFPVALKLHSKTVTHKSDVGGVKLGLNSEEEVAAAFDSVQSAVCEKAGPQAFDGVTVQRMVSCEDGHELIIGSSPDPQLGPVLLFGAGGREVETFRDCSLGLPPLTTTLARRLMERTRIYKALEGTRGRKAVDLDYLAEVLVRFSELVAAEPEIREIELNPFFVSSSRCIALDARIVLYDNFSASEPMPPVIRSYPGEYVSLFHLKNALETVIRPIRPEDEPQLARFHSRLSESSVRRRYFKSIGLSERVAHERLAQVCFNDYAREIALVAEYRDVETKRFEIAGVARLSRIRGTDDAKFAIVIADEYQNQGLGTRFMELLMEIARREKIHRIVSDILPENTFMQRLCAKKGFKLTHGPHEMIRAVWRS